MSDIRKKLRSKTKWTSTWAMFVIFVFSENNQYLITHSKMAPSFVLVARKFYQSLNLKRVKPIWKPRVWCYHLCFGTVLIFFCWHSWWSTSFWLPSIVYVSIVNVTDETRDWRGSFVTYLIGSSWRCQKFNMKILKKLVTLITHYTIQFIQVLTCFIRHYAVFSKYISHVPE